MDMMIAFLPSLAMLAFAIMVWRRRLANGPPIVWTRGLVLTLSLAVLGALAVPVIVASLVQAHAAPRLIEEPGPAADGGGR